MHFFNYLKLIGNKGQRLKGGITCMRWPYGWLVYYVAFKYSSACLIGVPNDINRSGSREFESPIFMG